MDSPQDTDEYQGKGKTSLEALSREELVKKYKQAILIAQKAKESKAEFVKHIVEHENHIKALEEKLRSSTEEAIKEAHQKQKIEAELKDALELISSMKSKQHPEDETKECIADIQHGTEKKDEDNIDNNLSKFESEAHIVEDTIKSQDVGLSKLKNELEAVKESKAVLEKILSEKDQEIEKMIKEIDKKNENAEKCFTELKNKIKALENKDDSRKAITELEELVQIQNEAINKWKTGFQRFEKEIDERIEENTRLILQATASEEEMQLKTQAIQSLTSEVEDTREKLARTRVLITESNNKIYKLECQNKRVSEKMSSLESEKIKLDAEVEEYRRKIDNLKEESRKYMSEKDEELKLLRETVNEEKKPCNDCQNWQLENSLTKEKMDKNELETSQIVRSLENNIEERDLLIVALTSDLEELKKELSGKDDLFEKNKREMAELNNQLTTFRNQENFVMESVEKLKEEKNVLEQKAKDKDEELISKENTISALSSELLKLRDQLDELEHLSSTQTENNSLSQKILALESDKEELSTLLSEKCDDIQKCQECIRDLTVKIQDLHEKLAEKGTLLESMPKQDEIESARRAQEELREQVRSLQETLHHKELLAQDLEQELAKLKDAITNETTNTEVSSTFSFSRAEELSRMKDLEDSFEDKYTKLRVVAVKLKKRVTDLTQTLEGERTKSANEKADLQAKLTHLASHAKAVQTLQSEVDRLQDLLEVEKKNQQQLTKLLDAAVKESAEKKFKLASVQEDLLRISNEKQSLESSISNLESSRTDSDSLRSEIDKLGKELKYKDHMLETTKEEKLKLAEQLEEIGADAKKKSVLSLEMADMEKSVSKLTSELSSERDNLKKTKQDLEEERSSFLTLNEKFRNLECKLQEREKTNQDLQDSLIGAKEEINCLQSKCKEQESAATQLLLQLEKQQALVEDLNIQCSDLAAEQVQTKEKSRLQIDKLSRQVFQLEEQCALLKESHKALEDELAAARTEFDNYKVRAQSVLRQSVKQEDRSVSSSTVHHAEELEVEVERLRVNVSSLKANLHQTTAQLQSALQEVNVEREEKLRAVKQAQINKESCAQAIERQHAAEERLSVLLDESRQAKLQSEMLVQCYQQQLEDLKTNHQKKIASLTEQLETLQATITKPPTTHAEGDQPSGIQSGPSPVADWAVQLSNAAHSDPDLAMRLSSLQREEGEGSESVDSFPSRRISVTTQERRHELIPLDKLLSSPMYPEDDIRDVPRVSSSDLSVDLLQSKLSACESRAAHLTALLSEAESDAARLAQLNAVLKEEIRRQQRSEERAQHAHNLEYLKNVVVKFITLQNGDERQRLVPVLNTILKLSPEEASLVETAAKGSSQISTSSGWGSYLPSWSGS